MKTDTYVIVNKKNTKIYLKKETKQKNNTVVLFYNGTVSLETAKTEEVLFQKNEIEEIAEIVPSFFEEWDVVEVYFNKNNSMIILK